VNAHVNLGVERGPQLSGCHDFEWRPGRDDSSVAHEHDPRGEARGGIEVVHCDYARNAIVRSHLQEEFVKRETMTHIQECLRLVEEQEAGFLGQRSGDRDTPLFAAAQGLDLTLSQGREIAAFQGLAHRSDILVALAHPDALVRRAAHRNNVAHPKPRRRHLALWHERHDTREGSAIDVGYVATVDGNRAATGREEACSNAQQSRLASAVCS
jgi:hypothetical protein